MPGRSSLETETKSNVHPIHASATRLDGFIEGEVGPDGRPDFELPYKARLEVPLAAMGTGNRLQDMEMQRRMKAREHPVIRVDLIRAWNLGPDGMCRASFQVTARGRSRSYEENFSLSASGGRIVVEGQHAFDMRDFGVDPPRFFAMKVEPEVKVRLRIEAEEVRGVDA